MASQKQIEANRRNALKSVGPKTEEGKAAVRLNALRHGVTAEAAVIPFVENPEDWEAHREGILESLSPVGHLETILAERVAMLLWRLGRANRYEREIAAIKQEEMEEDLFKYDTEKSPDHFQDRMENARDTAKLLKRLPRMSDKTKILKDDALDILEAAVCGVEDVELDKLSLPGLPDGAGLEDFYGWTAGILRNAIAVIAKEGGKSFDDLRHSTRFTFLVSEAKAKLKMEKAKTKLERARRKHILPDLEKLEKLSRYEAHLERSLYKSMHEIERLQAVRVGQPVPPPIALDVTVDAP